MPLNLIKRYNQHLELLNLNESQRTTSLLGIFNRDIPNNPCFTFKGKTIHPTPRHDGEDAMGNLFNHLTRKTTDKATNRREFDQDRSMRLHWIKYHIELSKPTNMLCFSIKEPQGMRTYIYDIEEKYVIILEPLRNNTAYYLLTAYPLKGKDVARNKIFKKYKRKSEDLP